MSICCNYNNNEFYSKFLNFIQHGNCFELISQFPDNFLFFTITSPPYWLARDYGTIPQKFDEKMDCEHEWIVFQLQGTSGGTRSKKVQIKSKANFQQVPISHQQLCIKCGCWIGEFGREPYLLDHYFTFRSKQVLVKGYLTHLCDLMIQILQKTRMDGSLWVNLGDKHYEKKRIIIEEPFLTIEGISEFQQLREFQSKTLCDVPHRFMDSMIDCGYIVRNDIIWKKRNPFPNPVTDRFTVNFENIFFIVKNNTPLYYVNEKTLVLSTLKPKGIHGEKSNDWYWKICDRCLETIEKDSSLIKSFLSNTNIPCADINFLLEYLPNLSSDIVESLTFHSVCGKTQCNNGKIKRSYWIMYDYYFNQQFEPLISKYAKTSYAKNKSALIQSENATYSARSYNALDHAHGKNKRAIWSINTANSKEDHCASFSDKLLEIPINACVPHYFCTQCGLPKIKIYQFIYESALEVYKGKGVKNYSAHLAQNPSDAKRRILNSMRKKREFVGYAHCQCNAPFDVGFGFDPFMGIGNTAKALLNVARNFFGIELNENYRKIGITNIKPKIENTRLDQFMK